MKKSFSLALGAAAVAAVSSFAGSANAAPAAVKWDLGSTFIIAGTGCQKDVDAFASTNGSDLAIVFTNLGVNLPGDGSSRQLADRKSCTVRVPAEIAKGLYIGKLTQQFTYGVTKTAGASGAVATRSTFFNFNVSPASWSVPQGVNLDEPLLTQTREDNFLVNSPWYQGWCNPNRSIKGLYQANIAVSGQRNNRYEDLILFVDGLDLKYEILASVYTC
ncbi:MAG: hypothetical protein U0169_23405 [Polyangiaceae bacterium]